MPFLDENGLARLWQNIVAKLSSKVEKSYVDELEASIRADMDEAIIGGQVDLTAYETKAEANAKLADAKGYTDEVAAGKSDTGHGHAISEITDLQKTLGSTQTALNKKVPLSRTINGKSLSGDITLDYSDVGAAEAEHNHDDRYYTEAEVNALLADKDSAGAAEAALATAKTYADSAANKVKTDLLNGAGAAYDTLKELGDLIDDNHDAIDALEAVAANKADADHRHNYYGICSTEAAVAAKTVDIVNFTLEAGAMVIVKFVNANSADTAPTLNVSGTGAIPMCRYGTTALSTGTTTTGWYAGAVQVFVYDGTSWVRDYWNNSTYSNAGLGQGYATCSTAAATKAKTASLSSYTLSAGGVVAVKFNNDVPASATLNVNSKGAKNIYYNGAAIGDGVIKAGDIATFIYSSQYHLLSVDRWHKDIVALAADLDDHNHDDKYYTESEVDAKLATKSDTHSHPYLPDTTNYAGSSSKGGAADSVKASLTFNNSGSGAASGTTFNGSTAKTISYNTIGAASASHSHNDTYYTEEEVDSKLAAHTNIKHIGTAGAGTNAEVFNGSGSARASGDYSHAEGYGTYATGKTAHAEGESTAATHQSSHAEGLGRASLLVVTGAANATTYTAADANEASALVKPGVVVQHGNSYAKVTGFNTTTLAITLDKTLSATALTNQAVKVLRGGVAYGSASHSEGYYSTASGDIGSHAEGCYTVASGYSAHTEGTYTVASGDNSHAEGYYSTASGVGSHAEGYGTAASGQYQHVEGKFNLADFTSAHIVGNGTDTTPSNAHTLDWSGNAWFAGDVYVGSTSGITRDTGSKKLATEDFVNTKFSYGTTELTAGTSDLATGSFYFVYK